MNIVEFAHLREVYVDSLEALLVGPICRQVAGLYRALHYKHALLDYALSELLARDPAHFGDALKELPAAELGLLLPRALLAQHVLLNRTADGVPVVAPLKFVTGIYKAIFRDLLDHLDMTYYRSLKCLKHVHKVVRCSVRAALSAAVPPLDLPAEPPVRAVAAPPVDDEIVRLLNPSKDITMAAPAPLPISPSRGSAFPTTEPAASGSPARALPARASPALASATSASAPPALVVPPASGGEAAEAVELNAIFRDINAPEPHDSSIKEYHNAE